MQSPQSPEEGLFQEHERADLLRQRAEIISAGYEAQLRGAGIDFDSDAAIDERLTLTFLAYRRLNYETAVEKTPDGVAPEDENPYLRDETRNLQAHLIVGGINGKPWLDLVDEQFPGAALTDSPEDVRFVADKIAERAEQTAADEEHFFEVMDEFHAYLQEHGVEPLAVDEFQLLMQLTVLRGASSGEASEMDRINRFDRARSLLMNSNVEKAAVWDKLVKKFFAD